MRPQPLLQNGVEYSGTWGTCGPPCPGRSAKRRPAAATNFLITGFSSSTWLWNW